MDTDLSTFAPDVDAGDVFDVGAGTDDGGAVKKPGAAGAGVPGCSIGGSGSSAAALGALMLALFAVALAPSLKRRRSR